MSLFLGPGIVLAAFLGMGVTVPVGLFGYEFLERVFGVANDEPEPDPAQPDEDEPFDTFEDEWDDEWLDDTEEANTTVDLEPRVEELEEEVDRLTSTVSTVRSENEAIADTVDEIEDNIRKLLEIYEVVSQEANPFVEGGEVVDETQQPPVGDQSSTDALFEQVSEDLDLEVDEGGLGGMEAAGGLGGSSDAPSEEAMTFEDLKSEYRDGGATAAEPAGEDVDRGPAAPPSGEIDEPDEVDAPAEAPGGHGGGEDRGSRDPPNAAAPPDSPREDRAGSTSAGKPYLRAVPDGYLAELLMLEWVDFLTRSAETGEVLWAIDYYHRIDWIGEAVADHLRTVVEGLSAEPSTPADTFNSEPGSLTVDDHARSLEFVSRLDGDPIDLDGLSTWSEE